MEQPVVGTDISVAENSIDPRNGGRNEGESNSQVKRARLHINGSETESVISNL